MKFWIFSFLLLFTSCSHKKPIVQAPPSFPVKIATAEKKTVPVFIESLGHVESIISIQIKSRIEGELTGVFFEQGKEVKKGDLLFTIDAKPYEAALKSVQGVLDQNRANQVLAEEKVKRYTILTKDEYYSQIDYETLQANLAATSALVQQAQGEVDKAAINLNYCWIYAPIDGMMGLLNIDFGNLVSADGTVPLTSLNQMAPIYVTFSIPEFQLPLIQKAHKKNELKVTAAYENFEEEIFEGTLYMVDNQVNQETGMIKLRAIFENKNRELWPGQFIRTRLILSRLENSVIIPHSAVQLTPNGPIVFVLLDNNTVEERKVQLGPREDGHVVITQGVKEQEKVILDGQINLSNGASVRVVAQ